MHFIEEVFGEGCDLYADVLGGCPRDADRAGLRKHYYRAALKYHPDRNASSGEQEVRQFQAISLAYQILQDEDSRADYDETGAIPDDAPDDDDKDAAAKAGSGSDQWKRYFDNIFGKVTRDEIDAFATKYKCSDEERRDVLKQFRARNGNLVKMLDYVMLSEPRDAIRWVEDYIRPAFDSGELDDDASKYKSTMEKTLVQCQRKAEKENEGSDDDDDEKMEDEDDEETETEEDEEVEKDRSPKKRPADTSNRNNNSGKPQKKTTPAKGQPTKAKTKKKKTKGSGNDMSDLVAQIRNKNRGGGGVGGGLLASLGARYGVDIGGEDGGDNDPMNDDEFYRIQSHVKKKQQKKKTR